MKLEGDVEEYGAVGVAVGVGGFHQEVGVVADMSEVGGVRAVL